MGPFQLLLSTHGSRSAKKSALNLTMGNIADVCVWASTDGVIKSPKRCDYASTAEPGFGFKKGVYVMQSLMNGKDFFKAQQIYIYIYI